MRKVLITLMTIMLSFAVLGCAEQTGAKGFTTLFNGKARNIITIISGPQISTEILSSTWNLRLSKALTAESFSVRRI